MLLIVLYLNYQIEILTQTILLELNFQIQLLKVEYHIYKILENYQKFVKQHYKAVWIFNLLFCFLFFQKKIQLLPFFRSLFYKRLHADIDFSSMEVSSNIEAHIQENVDVIIPTLGRKACLYDVLKDLSKQTILPKNVIIVEQNPIKDAVSELDYLSNQTWPFTIKHHFIHQTGACNARNLALSLVENDWVFFDVLLI